MKSFHNIRHLRILHHTNPEIPFTSHLSLKNAWLLLPTSPILQWSRPPILGRPEQATESPDQPRLVDDRVWRAQCSGGCLSSVLAWWWYFLVRRFCLLSDAWFHRIVYDWDHALLLSPLSFFPSQGPLLLSCFVKCQNVDLTISPHLRVTVSGSNVSRLPKASEAVHSFCLAKSIPGTEGVLSIPHRVSSTKSAAFKGEERILGSTILSLLWSTMHLAWFCNLGLEFASSGKPYSTAWQ